MRHPSLANIEWQDLRQLKPTEIVCNIFLSLPFYCCHGEARGTCGKGFSYLLLLRRFSFLPQRSSKPMIAIIAL